MSLACLLGPAKPPDAASGNRPSRPQQTRSDLTQADSHSTKNLMITDTWAELRADDADVSPPPDASVATKSGSRSSIWI